MVKERLWPMLGVCAAGCALLWLLAVSLFDRAVLNSTEFTPVSLTSWSQLLGTSQDAAAPVRTVDPYLLEKYGRFNLRLSRAHEGSGYRIQRVLERLENGEEVKTAVIGGSVSNGHGMSAEGVPFVYGAVKETWHKVVSSWLNATYGPQPFINGAMAATDSTFFRYCWAERVQLAALAPDLVFIELDVNDVADEVSRQATELLVRSVLLLPNKPAVIFVGAVALVSQSTRDGMLNGGDAHAPIASYYDIPHISLRGPLLPALMANHTVSRAWFNGDPRHIAALGHQALGELVIAFLQDQRCLLDEVDTALPLEGSYLASDLVGKVPPRLMREKWDAKTVHATAPPICRIAGATLEPAVPSPDWSLYSFREVKTYLETQGDGHTIEFDVEVVPGSAGEVGIGFLRSQKYKLGKALCQVGTQKKLLDGYWTRKASLTEIELVATGLSPGVHRLTCTTVTKGKGFRIAAVVSA